MDDPFEIYDPVAEQTHKEYDWQSRHGNWQWQMLLYRMTVFSLRHAYETIAPWGLAAKFYDGDMQQLRGLLSLLCSMSGDGVLMMSVDNLPAELPSEASAFFGSQLLPYIQYYLTVR
jgi:hypothetical protein